MIIYEDILDNFFDHVRQSRIMDEIKEAYERRGLDVGNDAEVRSWRLRQRKPM